MDPLHSLNKKSLKKYPIGQTENFEWFFIEIGIAAILKVQHLSISSLDPVKEALQLDLDLSKEQQQLLRIEKKQILLFYL
tara:strand:- start:388 stop:627 length:240 start_codon:yes stop_codon:yes gene_type:complete